MAAWILGCAIGFTSSPAAAAAWGSPRPRHLSPTGPGSCSALRTRPRPRRPWPVSPGNVAGDAAAWVVADNADPATPARLIAARERFSRLDGALISVGGSPSGTVAATTDQARRSAFESVFLGAVRLARVLAGDLSANSDSAVAGSVPGTAGSIVFVLASSVRVPLEDLAISNGLFPGLAGATTLADELGPAGIRINGPLPVRIATDRVRELDVSKGDPDEVRARVSEHIPLRR